MTSWKTTCTGELLGNPTTVQRASLCFDGSIFVELPSRQPPPLLFFFFHCMRPTSTNWRTRTERQWSWIHPSAWNKSSRRMNSASWQQSKPSHWGQCQELLALTQWPPLGIVDDVPLTLKTFEDGWGRVDVSGSMSQQRQWQGPSRWAGRVFAGVVLGALDCVILPDKNLCIAQPTFSCTSRVNNALLLTHQGCPRGWSSWQEITPFDSKRLIGAKS